LYAVAAAELLTDLAAVGFSNLEEVGDLRRRRIDYRTAVPILIDWLPKVSYLMLADDIVRTLSVTLAKRQALPEFLKLFREPPDVEDPIRPATSQPAQEHLRWVIGNGIGIFAAPDVANETIELAIAREYGPARTQIVLNLPKTKDARVPEVLLELFDDPSVVSFAIQALDTMKVADAGSAIENMLSSSDENVRDQAKKALKRIRN
jgi:hypothetical protein